MGAKSFRFDYVRRPCFDKMGKHARKKLHKTFRAYTKQTLRVKEDFKPMSRRCSWG